VDFKDLPQNNWAYPYVFSLVSKYKIFTGYPDGTFKPNKTITKSEMVSVVSRALKASLSRYEISPEVKFSAKLANASNHATRYDAAIISAKLIDYLVFQIDKLGEAKIKALQNKYSKYPEVKTTSQVYKQMETGKPRTYISGFYGNVNESASGTNNWMNFGAALSQGNPFRIWNLSGDYEFSGRYYLNQIVTLTPNGIGGGISAGIVNEHRVDLDLNTIYHVGDFYGFKGLAVLGLKYAMFINPLAPVSFGAVNVGVGTIVHAFGTNVSTRVFYSLIPTMPTSSSALGPPVSILNYELGFDYKILKTPVLLGYSGETIFINGGTYSRSYNMVFARYFFGN